MLETELPTVRSFTFEMTVLLSSQPQYTSKHSRDLAGEEICNNTFKEPKKTKCSKRKNILIGHLDLNSLRYKSSSIEQLKKDHIDKFLK